MDYSQTLDYIFNKLPMYQRIGGAAYKADLGNTLQLCKLLGNPERNFRSIHIAGTNGKGSVSHILASVLQEAGLKTGLYTSPHYADFRERIRINGAMIPEKYVVSFIESHKDQFGQIGLSFFEMTVGLAFSYFAEEAVDIAVIETGLGGRLDSTNVIMPEVSVITNIGMDHMRFLGNSLQSIAKEKAGIIKKSVPVVIGETQTEPAGIFISRAAEMGASIYFADQLWKIMEIKNDQNENHLEILHQDRKFLGTSDFSLKGSFQKQNLITALEAIRQLNFTKQMLTPAVIRQGIENVVKNTGFKGRWQVLNQKPLIVCDSGHNREGISEAVKNLLDTPHKNLHMVIGMVNDKDVPSILRLLPKEATYYFCRANIPRGLDAQLLSKQACEIGLNGTPYQNVKEALDTAKRRAKEDDLIFVGGSTFVVAEVV